jgi:hypothetical protein
MPVGCATARPLTLHMQLPALEPGAVPCSCDAGDHTERLTGLGSCNAMRQLGRVGTGRSVRHLLPVAAPGQRPRQESQLSCLSVDSSVALMTRRGMATIPGWRRSSRPALPGSGSVPTRERTCPARVVPHSTNTAQPVRKLTRVPAISEAVR